MPCNKQLELRDQLLVQSEREVAVDPVDLGPEAKLLESPNLRYERVLASQVPEGFPAPEGERVLQERGGSGGIRP